MRSDALNLARSVHVGDPPPDVALDTIGIALVWSKMRRVSVHDALMSRTFCLSVPLYVFACACLC